MVSKASKAPIMAHGVHDKVVVRSWKLVAHAAQQKQEKEEEEEKLMLQKASELDDFDQQNHGAVPLYNDRSYTNDKNGFHGANSVKVTSYEEA
ncbi:hypothetical protein Droror1_Dr00026059 [Drosera rotundifolia]